MMQNIIRRSSTYHLQAMGEELVRPAFMEKTRFFPDNQSFRICHKELFELALAKILNFFDIP